MKKCSVAPYSGEQKYIYISHSFKDKRYVYPIIEQLAKDGYRLWYDQGIISGSEATSEIAERILKCDLFLAFFSDNTIDSYQFKREANFAILKKKKIIAIMLEDVQMSPGMEMQIAAFPAIYKYKIDNERFYKTLYSMESIGDCIGVPDESICVSDENEYVESLADLYGADERKIPPLEDALFAKAGNEEDVIMPKAVLKKLTTNEEIEITTPKMIIGRAMSEKNKPVVDYSIETNSMVSRIHAVIVYKNKEFYLIDCGAVNKTYLNGEELKINEEYLLHDGDVVKLANEKFCFKRIEV